MTVYRSENQSPTPPTQTQRSRCLSLSALLDARSCRTQPRSFCVCDKSRNWRGVVRDAVHDYPVNVFRIQANSDQLDGVTAEQRQTVA
jgi:hypothetical protein